MARPSSLIGSCVERGNSRREQSGYGRDGFGPGKRSAPGASDRYPHGPSPLAGSVRRRRIERVPKAAPNLGRRRGIFVDGKDVGSIPARAAEDGSAEADWGGDLKRASALVDW